MIQHITPREMELSRQVDELRDKLIAAEHDAARYRWLRNRIPGSAYRIAGVIYSEGGEGVDAAIDAAVPGANGLKARCAEGAV